MDVSMDIFVNQFGCFLPMQEVSFDGPPSRGAWCSPFSDDGRAEREGQIFDDILAAVRPIYED